MDKKIDYDREILEGFRTATINAAYQSNLAYRPEFLSNNPSTGRKVLVSIEQELVLSGKLNDVPSGRLFCADFGFLQMSQSL